MLVVDVAPYRLEFGHGVDPSEANDFIELPKGLQDGNREQGRCGRMQPQQADSAHSEECTQ